MYGRISMVLIKELKEKKSSSNLIYVLWKSQSYLSPDDFEILIHLVICP